MEQSTRLPTNPPNSPESAADAASEQSTHHGIEAEDLLALLGDEYTYRVFEAVVEKPRTGRELIEATDASKPTVYRRLQELEEAGLVEATMNIASDGNHCKQFHAVVTSLEVTFDADGFTASVTSESCSGAAGRAAASAQPPADD
jgi:DNA-binding transcriptional ArsR family regulator